MKPTSPVARLAAAPRAPQRGFTLVEMLVGVVIALVGSLVIFQTVLVWDQRTRTTTTGGEAQMTGALAMYNLERDIRLAGMGFGKAPWQVMGCTLNITDTRDAGRTLSPLLVPVRITSDPDNAGAPDTITVFHGNSAFFTAAQPFQASTANDKKVQRRYGFQPGDLVVVAGNQVDTTAGSANCDLVQITKNDNADQVTLDHANGGYADFYTGVADTPSAFNATNGTGTTYTSGLLFNLGRGPQLNRWRINTASHRVLEWSDDISALAAVSTAPNEVADGIVNLKAQYGIDSNSDGVIDSWIPNATDPGPPDAWTKVRAIRVAILVRGTQFEPPLKSGDGVNSGVTSTAPTWSGGSFSMRNVDGSEDSFGAADYNPNNWRYYRYRVYEREIPLRNMIWGTEGQQAAPASPGATP